MTTIRIRIARLAAASALTLTLTAAGAGPALASYNSWAGSVPDAAVTFGVEDDASPAGGGNPFPHDAATDGVESPTGSIQSI